MKGIGEARGHIYENQQADIKIFKCQSTGESA
jgi:hypothetical protein